MVAFSVFFFLVGVENSHANNKKGKGTVHVYDSTQLKKAMTPANAGRVILVHAGDYSVAATLLVPDGATLRGESRMRYDDGYPDGFKEGTGTNLTATMALIGDIVQLGNGSRMENLLVRDIDFSTEPICTDAEVNTCQVTADRARCCRANRGNVVLVASRARHDYVEAKINECELDTPNFSGIAPSGPTGRAVAVLNRNLNLGAPPEAFTDSTVSATITKSTVRAANGGSGVFAINFAARSHIDVLLLGNNFEGGLDSNGGVSRPDAVQNSMTSITSIGNLYRPQVPGSIVGWSITGGSGAPIPFAAPQGSPPPPPVTTKNNSLDMFSLGDRIEDCYDSIVAAGGIRSFFDLPPQFIPVGPSSHNRLDLQLYGTKFVNSLNSDLYMIGAYSVENFPTGDFNSARALVFGADGGDLENNFYSDAAYGIYDDDGNWVGDEDLPPENRGQGNELRFRGSLWAFLLANDGFDQSPPPREFFLKAK